MAVTLVDSAHANGGGGGSLAASLSGAPTAGNMLIAHVSWAFAATISSIVAGAGKTLTDAGNATNSSAKSFLFYRPCDGTENASTTVTFSAGGTAWLWIGEFNGIDTFQSAATNTGTGTSVTCGTDGDAATILDIGAVCADVAGSAFISPLLGYTIDNQGTGGPSYCLMYDGDRMFSNNASVTNAGGGDWAAVHATFELAAGFDPLFRLRADGKY